MYVIQLIGEDKPYYWTCRFGETDNYSCEIEDATIFRSKSAAYAMCETVGKEDNVVVEITGVCTMQRKE